MARGFLDRTAVTQAQSLFAEYDGNVAAVARQLNLPRETVQGWKSRGWLTPPIHDKQDDIEFPFLHDPDPPIEDLIERAEEDFQRRRLAHNTRQWMRFKLKDDKPFGLAFVGDPHIDDGGCNWTLFRKHHRLLSETPGVYPIGMGDYINNWSGALVKIHKEQSIQSRQAFKLAEWIFGSLPWMLLIKGNHDMWSSQYGTGDPLDFMQRGPAPLEDWHARFIVETPNSEFKIHARHDFKGHSFWNDMHALMKAFKMGDQADILVAGHRHVWGHARGEHNGHTCNLIRARGYKYIDDYAERHQFESQEDGATMLAVCHPASNNSDKVIVFSDLETGCAYIKAARAR